MAEEPTTPEVNQTLEDPAATQAIVAQPQTAPVTPAPPGDGTEPPKAETASENYWKRHAESARKQADEATKSRDELATRVKGLEDAELSDKERLERESTDATERATKAELKAARLEAIVAAELSPELAELVPEGTEDPAKYIEEKIMPLRKKLGTPEAFGNPTQPPRTDIPDEKALVLGKFNSITDEKERQAFYNTHYEMLGDLLPQTTK